MKKRAFSLLEVMIVILIFVVGISGALATVSNIINNFSLATNRFVAQNLAIEKVENIRNQRDNNLLALQAWNHNLINITDSIVMNGIEFTRTITIIPDPDPVLTDRLKIKSKVTWIERVEIEREIIVIKLFQH